MANYKLDRFITVPVIPIVSGFIVPCKLKVWYPVEFLLTLSTMSLIKLHNACP